MITSLAYFGATSPAYKEWETFGPTILGCELTTPAKDGAVRLRFDELSYRMAIHPGEKTAWPISAGLRWVKKVFSPSWSV